MASSMQKVGDYDISMGDKLGSGNFGAVYKGTHYKTKEEVVGKVIPLHTYVREYAIAEVEILKLGKRHQNIVQIYYDEIQKNEMWIIMELCNHGNLATYAMKNALDLYNKVDIILQCTDALVYLLNLEGHRVVHRDLKPSNILLKSDAAGISAKISDFGVSKRVQGSSATHQGTGAGTLHFKAPEQFESEADYNRSVDVFAIGVIIYYLIKVVKGQNMEELKFLGDSIGHTMFVLRKHKSDWHPVEIKDSDSAEMKMLKSLMKKTIVYEPEGRIRMEEAHQDLANIKEELKPKKAPSTREMATTKSITPLPLRPSSPKEEEAGLAEAFATAVSVSRTPSGRKGKKEKAMKSVPRLEKVQSVELEHTASFSVGFGDGTVLLGDEDNRKLVKYSVDTKMGIEWSKDQPQGIRVHCNKTFTSNQIICQNDSSAPTHQYSLALHPQSTHQHDGRLCGSLSQDRIAYARKIRDMKYCLDVYQTSPTHTKVASLTPPGEAFQTEYISVSDHPDRGMAVLDEASRTLHLYDISYTHQHQVELPYHPHWRNAVTSFKDWIVIIDKKKCLHVHTWEGEKVCEFSNDKLGLGMRGILGIRQAGEEGLMLAAEPDHWKTDSLHLYHVK